MQVVDRQLFSLVIASASRKWKRTSFQFMACCKVLCIVSTTCCIYSINLVACQIFGILSKERGRKLSSINITCYPGTLLPSTCYLNDLRGNIKVKISFISQQTFAALEPICVISLGCRIIPYLWVQPSSTVCFLM